MRKCRVAVAFAATFAGAKPESMNGAGDQALDEQIRTFQRTANVESVRRAKGLSVREYALTTLAINMAMMPTNDSEYREYVPRKPGDPMDVAASPEHVRFVQQHLSEIRAGAQVIAVAIQGREIVKQLARSIGSLAPDKRKRKSRCSAGVGQEHLRDQQNFRHD